MKQVKIGDKFVGKRNPCFISFEPGATFSDFDQSKKMLNAVSNSGADAVKFQTFLENDAERMIMEKNIQVEFGTSSGKLKENVYEALKRRELSNNEWKKLVELSKNSKLLFITAPYFPETVDFLEKIGIDAFKVSKGDINNVLLIDKISKTKIPIILDAREKLEDLNKAIKICEENGNSSIIIMHCPSGYPSENSGVNLNAISYLVENYDYPVGFSDHSPGDQMNYGAIALGASMLEKTITSDKKIEQVEHFMSLELEELKKFVINVKGFEEALGNSNVLDFSRVEPSARRCFVLKKDIKKGDIISEEVLDYRRPENFGISVSEGFSILGKKVKSEIKKGTILQWEMLD